MPRSKVMRVSPELDEVLRRSLKNFNQEIAIPKFKRPMDMVDWSSVVAHYLDDVDLERRIFINPKKKNKRSLGLETRNNRLPF